MRTPRRVTAAVVPLALLAAGCGTAGPGSSDLPADVRGIDIPTEALVAPTLAEPVTAAPVAAARARVPAVRAAVAAPAPARTELDDVPTAALTAYHRAATVMGQAAPGCGLQWPLLAAIGRVETKHGRGRLDDEGLARPALVGAPLNGRHRRPRVRDTDAGQLDGDRRWDRVLGPFRILPSTWSVVGVDADGDDQRDPQDVDDAALGTAVQLCGTRQDLSSRAGMRAALRRLRSQRGYPAAVLAWYDAYVAAERSMQVAPVSVVAYGDWSAAVTAVTELASTPAPEPTPTKPPRKPTTTTKKKPGKAGSPSTDVEPSPEPASAPPAESAPPAPVAAEPAAEPTPAEPAPEPEPEPAPSGDPPPPDPGTGTGTGPGEGECPTPEPTDGETPAPAPTDGTAPEDEACLP